MELEISYLNPIECQVTPVVANIIRDILSYKAIYYIQSQFKKTRKEYQKSTLTSDSNNFYFYSGFLPRVLDYLEGKLGFEVKILNQPSKIPFAQPDKIYYPLASKFKYYDQTQAEAHVKLLAAALHAQRGIIVAPTGIGKTTIGIVLAKCFLALNPKFKVLWLCHTKDSGQTEGDFLTLSFKRSEIGVIEGARKDVGCKITIATRTSFKNLIDDIPSIAKEFDMVIIDESHHLKKFKGTTKDDGGKPKDSEYVSILKRLPCALRYGLTATPNRDDAEEEMVSEAFLGKVVAEMTLKEGHEKGLLAKPKVKFIKMKRNYALGEVRAYNSVYEKGVVNNEAKHEKIMLTAKEHVKQGDSVLIFVQKIEHGQNLLVAAHDLNVPAILINGASDNVERATARANLNNKKVLCVISSIVWTEKINIPELNAIINAMELKDEGMLRQIMGRGLRRTATKKELIYYDIFDPSNVHLISHFGERICTYSENGWL